MLNTFLKGAFLVLLIGGVAYILIGWVKKAPAPVPEWAKWLVTGIIIVLAPVLFLAAMGWLHYVTPA